MRKLIHPTAVISIALLALTVQGCFWNPPELSLANSEAELERSEVEAEFAPEATAELERGEGEAEFAPEATAEADGGEGEAEFTSQVETEITTSPYLTLTGNYTLEFTKTAGQSQCAPFGEVLDLKVSDEGLMTGYLYYSGSRGGPFSGRIRPNGSWSAISPDEGYKFEGNISDEEVSGNYTAPAPAPTEDETRCEGTVEGFKTPD